MFPYKILLDLKILKVCLLTTALVQSVDVDQYGGLFTRELSPGYLQNTIEDEVDYLASSKDGDLVNYDWSPPNGELPDTNLNAADSLTSYFGDGDGGREGDSWIEQEGSTIDREPNNDLKRSFEFIKQKKNQILCRVQRAVHHHSEAGYEFFPKTYTSYSCHPVGPSQSEGSLSTSHETCFVTGNNCITIEKEQLFLKRRQITNCWTHFIEAVGAGCKCLSRKYYV